MKGENSIAVKEEFLDFIYQKKVNAYS